MQNKEYPNLRECPLCGGEAEFVKLFESKRYDGFVRCTQCDNEGRVYSSKQNAVKAWNRRNDNGR